jgi:hypothetical protein
MSTITQRADEMILGGGFLMIGGCLVVLVGMVWQKTVDLLRTFGVNAKSGAGVWVLLAGLAMMAAGYGLLVLGKEVDK